MLSAPSSRPGRSREAVIKRCAIYTRKSAVETIERNLSTLDAQRQFCESFVASQAGEGWVALDTRYDDGGFSGGSLERPAVKRLREDIAAGTIDMVVVYKIDRLSRSLIDFSRLMGDFDAKGVGFVSVTQAFNTSHSMGRLTLNVLLSFAQFERELASERLRDKAAAARAKGLWHPGERPFGYRVEKGRLTVHEGEAETIRTIFRRYAQLGSCRRLAQELNAKGHRNKRGGSLTTSSVRNYLGNRLYRGDLVFRGTPIPGTHEAIISEAVWLRTRAAIEAVILRHRPPTRPMVPNPLKGRLFAATGGRISQDFNYNRYGKRYRYYMPSGRRGCGVGAESGWRFRADEFDAGVLSAIAPYVPRGVDATRSSPADLLVRLVVRIDIGSVEMEISLRTGASVTAAVAGRIARPVATPEPAQVDEILPCPETERAPIGEARPMPVHDRADAGGAGFG